MIVVPVKKSLVAVGAAVLALVTAACSQQTAPGEAAEPATPVVEAPAVKLEKKVKPSPRRKAEASRTAGQPASTPAEKPLTFRPVEMTGPFVASAPGKRIARVNVPGPYVAVTFDDGPHATLTPQVLDIFNRHGAHATFFVLGRNANRNRSLLARAAAEGHEIGAHTWSHINMRASSLTTIKDELDRTNRVIESATGHYPRVMRPPYGSVTMPLVNMVYNRYGTPAILWDVDTNDWRKPGRQAIINRAVGKARPGSIILLHDIHPSTIDAVEDVVTGLQARGFKLVTVSELISLARGAAGASAPAREAEASAPAPAVATPTPVEPEAPLHAGQQQPQPEGSATLGVEPAPQPAPVATPDSRSDDDDFDFFES